ncbi:xanthine permease [Bacillus sp. FJAT-27225]|uniref:purine/pyrimidine permease n=1 Tax=Bacillus sp. FJAT-27225 TaxID=1743144 RepID=UPI00080C2B6F|nr:xanthine permease [Bacillus sp. FJAT-27225]
MRENYYLSTFQWFVYLLANSVALPIVLGNIFDLSLKETSELMQRTFFVVGLSSFIQARWGHRFPIADGPAGSWVSIFILYASIGVEMGYSLKHSLQILEAGLMISGLLLLILGITKWVRILIALFTPLVTGTFLFILAIQLSGVFLTGMMSGKRAGGELDSGSFILSAAVFFLIFLLTIKGKDWMKSYSILIGILLGWGAFALLGKSHLSEPAGGAAVQLPGLWEWGTPVLNESMIITAVLFSFLLISNTIAAITASSEVHQKEDTGKEVGNRLSAGVAAGGISHLLSSVFSTVGIVPLPATAGFVKLSRQNKIIPFLFASIIMVGISLFPFIVSALSSLPLPVASAALMATLIEMLGISLKSLTRNGLSQRTLTVVGISLLVGIGIMFVQGENFTGLPNIIQNLVRNGLLLGTFTAIILERLWKEERM